MKLFYFKILLAPLLAFLFFDRASAQSCGADQTIRLDEGSGRLAKASIQDQDGLGTCYANAASLILQSSQPDLPDLSFLQMSINHLESMNSQRTDGKRSFDVDGGFICKAINSTVESQNKGVGLCPRSKVPAEGLRNIESAVWGPMDLLQKIDRMSKRPDPNEKKLNLEYFATIADNLKREVDRGSIERCKPPNYKIDYTKLRSVEVMEEIVMNALEQRQACIINNLPDYDSDYCIGLNRFNGFSSYAKSKRYRTYQSLSMKWEYRDKILKRIKDQGSKLRSPQDILKIIESELHFIAFGPGAKKQKSMLSEATAPLREKLISKLEDDFNLLTGQADESCRIQYAIEIMTKSPQLLTKAECKECDYSAIESNVNRLGNVINDLQVKNLSQIYEFIKTNSNQPINSQIMRIIAANCSPKDWIKLPENTKCEETATGFSPEDISKGTAQYREFVEKNRNRMIDSLKQGKAVGYSLCTRFLKDASFTYNAVEPRSDAQRKCQEDRHGFHAVALVGIKCKDGKAQYLVQNSWGSKWQPDRTDMTAENGKLWINESDFFGNGTDYSYIDGP